MSSVGCRQSEHPELRPVSGTVTYDGQPVSDATVAFSSPSSPRLATGRTDHEGRFVLSSYDPQDGAAPGEYTVVVTKIEHDDAQPALSMDEALETRPVRSKSRNLLPKRYAAHETTPLQVVVPDEGADDLRFELSDR